MSIQSEEKSKKIYFLLFLVPLFWGGAFGTAQHVITEISPLIAATLRFGSAGLLLLIIVLLRGEWNWKVLRRRWFGLFLMAITGIFSYNAFFFIALKYTNAVNGSLIMATSPVFITLGAIFFLSEIWNKRLGVGLFLSLTGVVLVIMQGSFQTLLSLSFNKGDLLFMAALASWVIHGLIGKIVMQGQGVSPLFTTTITTLIGSIFLAIGSFFDGEWKAVLAMSGQSWLEMIYMVVFATVIGFLLWNMGIHQIGASKASIYMNLVPINAGWIAVVLYGESVKWEQLFGMLLVITGVFIVTYKKNLRGLKVQT
ncbi:DMT family transporter [Gracilibacillus thailandensis]|uniref:EamA family transporter n=1 Tax=Gracilibacillus thailandensis TaxID=563735 RepID=A0A6N7QXM6_9BACI|nr:DMT family transporter [Gracilibacillus thailandensis]MRI66768.1 EamA family transporter [Gracilibacillus thailandensis]